MVADAEREPGAGRLELDHVAAASGELVVDAFQDPQRCLPVNGTEFRLGRGRPDHYRLIRH